MTEFERLIVETVINPQKLHVNSLSVVHPNAVQHPTNIGKVIKRQTFVQQHSNAARNMINDIHTEHPNMNTNLHHTLQQHNNTQDSVEKVDRQNGVKFQMPQHIKNSQQQRATTSKIKSGGLKIAKVLANVAVGQLRTGAP